MISILIGLLKELNEAMCVEHNAQYFNRAYGQHLIIADYLIH